MTCDTILCVTKQNEIARMTDMQALTVPCGHATLVPQLPYLARECFQFGPLTANYTATDTSTQSTSAWCSLMSHTSKQMATVHAVVLTTISALRIVEVGLAEQNTWDVRRNPLIWLPASYMYAEPLAAHAQPTNDAACFSRVCRGL